MCNFVIYIVEFQVFYDSHRKVLKKFKFNPTLKYGNLISQCQENVKNIFYMNKIYSRKLFFPFDRSRKFVEDSLFKQSAVLWLWYANIKLHVLCLLSGDTYIMFVLSKLHIVSLSWMEEDRNLIKIVLVEEKVKNQLLKRRILV